MSVIKRKIGAVIMAKIRRGEIRKVVNRIKYCETTDNPNIVKCFLDNEGKGEEIFIGHSDDLVSLAEEVTGASAKYTSSGTYVLGTKDEEGNRWYGGSDPSAYINNISHLEGEVHTPDEVYEEVVDNPLIRKLGDKDDLYVWRPNYPINHISQIISKKQLGLL